jgi:uncharacterized protein YqjF (DUF2071 family)
VLLTFEAPEELVRAQLPPGVDVDRWSGRAHVSLVALQMVDVRVLGWRIPGFTAHPQVNFRVYARQGAHAAVSFVRELVPSWLIAAVGRRRYNEPFRTAWIETRVESRADRVQAEYRFGPEGPRYRTAVTGSPQAAVPPETSFEHYLKERTHGCRSDRTGRLQMFRVEHAPWAVREVQTVDYEVDFGQLYGRAWEFLNSSRPVSVIFAVGSDVRVYAPETA